MNVNDWLDPDTFRVMFDVVNDAPFDGTNPKKPLHNTSGPSSWFRRVRLTAGSQLIEDLDQYNTLHEMFDIFNSPDSGVNEMVEGFGDKSNTHEDFAANEFDNNGFNEEKYCII